ncbi:hypothetical protein ACQ4PT_012512 [Festuca glaucescens]
MVGTCNGLLCLCSNKEPGGAVTVVNPTTRQKLPVPPLRPKRLVVGRHTQPDFPGAERLRQWYRTEGKNAAFTSLSVGMSSMGRTDVRKTVAQIKEEDMGKSEKPDWITVMGTVWNIKTDNFCYPACTAVVNGTRCTKKVTKDVDEMWQCESCEQSSQNCEYRYMLPCQIQDHTGTTMYATAFQDAGEEIIGLPAQDLFRIKHEEQDDEKFAEIIQRARYQHYLFKLKVKEETYNDEARVKCNIVKVQKLDDTAKESRFLLGVIDSLLVEDGSGSTPAVNGGAAINAGFTSNNTYAMNMGFPNQFGQQASLYGGMPSTPSATRYAQTGHVSRDSPVQANSYGPSAGGNASSALIWDTCSAEAYLVNNLSTPSKTACKRIADPANYFRGGTQMVGTCNGLLCLCSNKEPGGAVTVVNPTTRQKLPVPPLRPKRLVVGRHTQPEWDKAYSFGYHPITGRYKVVHVPCSFDGVVYEFDAVHVLRDDHVL